MIGRARAKGDEGSVVTNEPKAYLRDVRIAPIV